jgi:hypothetical protein
VKGLNLATTLQYEGFGYLGFGVLLSLFFITAYCAFIKPKYYIARLHDVSVRNRLLPAALCIAAFILLALSPVITLNSKIVFIYYIPGIEKLWSIFRSTGRFIWPVMYMIMCVVFYGIFKILGKKRAALFLALLLLVQYADLQDWFNEKGGGFKTRSIWQTELQSPEWKTFARKYKHIFFLGNYEKLYSFLDLAVRNNMTVNDVYLARKNSAQIEAGKKEEIESILSGRAGRDMIYIIQDDDQADLLKGYLAVSVIDGTIVGVRR